MGEDIFCAINKDYEIQWVHGSSSKTRYFRTDKYLKKAVSYHNAHHPGDPWKIARFSLLFIEETEVTPG